MSAAFKLVRTYTYTPVWHYLAPADMMAGHYHPPRIQFWLNDFLLTFLFRLFSFGTNTNTHTYLNTNTNTNISKYKHKCSKSRNPVFAERLPACLLISTLSYKYKYTNTFMQLQMHIQMIIQLQIQMWW